MGVNPHTPRGVWGNKYLATDSQRLTGKEPSTGNSPFSSPASQSACGTAREVGTFSHRLPAAMVVTKKNKAPRDRRRSPGKTA